MTDMDSRELSWIVYSFCPFCPLVLYSFSPIGPLRPIPCWRLVLGSSLVLGAPGAFPTPGVPLNIQPFKRSTALPFSSARRRLQAENRAHRHQADRKSFDRPNQDFVRGERSVGRRIEPHTAPNTQVLE